LDTHRSHPAGDEGPDGGPRDLTELRRHAEGGSADYAAVLHEYGEVMGRIGRLEAAVERLSNTLETVGMSPDGGTAAPLPHAAQREDGSAEIEHLRLQFTNLANQLTNAESELGRLTGGRSRRHRRARVPTPLWRKVLRRLGIE